jgi:hypothetical protein
MAKCPSDAKRKPHRHPLQAATQAEAAAKTPPPPTPPPTAAAAAAAAAALQLTAIGSCHILAHLHGNISRQPTLLLGIRNCHIINLKQGNSST